MPMLPSKRLRTFALTALAGFALAGPQGSLRGQEKGTTPPPAAERELDVPIRTFSYNVEAPTTIVDKRNGEFVTDLKASDFALYDNDKLQTISAEMAFAPLSMVVAVQANDQIEGLLPTLKRMGPVLANLVVGANGEAAIVAFDHRLQRLQDFTNDPDKLKAGLDKLRAGSTTSKLIDAVSESVRMLKDRPERRKVILLVSETRDRGSETRLREALTGAEFRDIMIYTLNISRVASSFTKPNPPPRVTILPPGAAHAPAGGTMTPNEQMQNRGSGTDFVPLFDELFRGVKGVFSDNPAEVFTKYTGGREFAFGTQRGMEESLAKLGTELRNQYQIVYQPNNLEEGGYHQIRVVVKRPNLEVRTRPGYWLAAVPR